MKSKNKLHPIILLICLCICINTNAQSIVLHFANGSDIVVAKDLEKFIQSEKREFSCSDIISIYGYTDNVGSDDDNKLLAEKRINTVKEFIEEYFLKENNDDNLPSFALINFGKQNPIAKNNTEKGREQNRRVEIIFSKKKCADQGKLIGDLYNLIKDKPQEFCINPDKDTALVGKEGTIVYYKSGTFVPNFNCSCITILLNEYLDNASFILNNLTTTSNGNVLESGGMTRLVGLCGKDTLQYQKDKFLTVMVPTDNALEDMKSLFANRNKQTDYLNWNVDTNFPEISILDWNGLSMMCGGVTSGPNIKDDCPLFLCKIRRFLKGKKVIKDDRSMERITEEETTIKQLGIDKNLLGDALLISRDKNANALKYYVYKNASWDYHNCDRFMNANNFTDMYVNETPNDAKDVKLIYKQNKSVVPAAKKNKYEFKNVFKNNEVWVVGLKYKDEQTAFVSISSENTKTKNAYLNFKEVKIEELKIILKKLN
jgi:OmpA family